MNIKGLYDSSGALFAEIARGEHTADYTREIETFGVR